MCRLCLNENTNYICVVCVKTQIKTVIGRNLLRRLVNDALINVNTKLEKVESCIPLIKKGIRIEDFLTESYCYLEATKYLNYFVYRSNHLIEEEYSPIKFYDINWTLFSTSVRDLRRLLTVLIRICPRILNHASKLLRRVQKKILVVLTRLDFKPDKTKYSSVWKGDAVKIGYAPLRSFNVPWQGKPTPSDYQETTTTKNWDPFVEEDF